DGMTLPLMSIGANGIVSVASHDIGKNINEMVKTFLAGDVRKAAKLHRTLLLTMEATDIAPSPAPVKAALNMSGIEVWNVRMPLVEIDETEKAFIKNILF